MGWKPTQKKLGEQVAEQIKKKIIAGDYPPGSRLPPERELAEQMGVTRLTVREALKETQQAGFTRTRHGDGTYVRDLSKNANLDLLTQILEAGRELSPQEIISLLEFRRVNFLGFADAVVQNAGPDHLRRLDEIIVRERALSHDIEGMVEADYEFHEQLAAASGNLIYHLFMHSVKAAYIYLCRIVFKQALETLGSLEPVRLAHEAMAAAVRAKNTQEFREQVASFVDCGTVIVSQQIGVAVKTPTEPSAP
jgi:GntR family transcriptional regulator, transcriptional repressor for pyruvate dehydrogenase complex